MKTKINFKNHNILELKETLLLMYKKKFKIIIEKSNNQTFKNYHTLKETKKNIAKLLTLITEKEKNIR